MPSHVSVDNIGTNMTPKCPPMCLATILFEQLDFCSGSCESKPPHEDISSLILRRECIGTSIWSRQSDPTTCQVYEHIYIAKFVDHSR